MIPRVPAACFFLFYFVYVGYEVLATYDVIQPVCFGPRSKPVCI